MILIILACVLMIVSYKMYVKYKAKKEIYDTMELTEQEKKTGVFSSVTNALNNMDKKTYLGYAIAFLALAILAVAFAIFK